EIVATVPDGPTGPISITTSSGAATSTSAFIITAGGPPVISSFSPEQGRPGTQVTIRGSNFTRAANVAFNCVSAQFNVDSNNTTITATAPGGVAAIGPISVTTPSGSASSGNPYNNLFPIITGFTPTSGPSGTTV